MAKKSFRDFLMDESPKNQKKINKAIESGNCQNMFSDLKMEVISGVTRDFPELGIIVTEHFVCRYLQAMVAFTGPLVIIPTAVIANLYRTNLDLEGKYDPSNFWLAVETKDDKLIKLGAYFRRNNDSLDMFRDLISYTRTKMI